MKEPQNQATEGNPAAQFQMALGALKAGRDDEFLQLAGEAAAQDFPPALFRLGIWRLSRSHQQDETLAARALVEKSANLGFPGAIRAMAIVCARGAGALPNWQEGLAWFKKTLELNDPRALREAAMLLRYGDGNAELSRTLLIHAATAGDGIASYHLGLLEAEGGNPGAGLFWLNYAHQRGHVLAAKAIAAYPGKTAITPERTPPALDGAEVEARLDMIEQPAVKHDIRVMLESPKVKCIKGVLESWECEYLIARSGPFLQPATTVEDLARGEKKSDHRTNMVAKFWIMQQDMVVNMMERKIAHVGETPLDYAEDLGVLYYKPGEKNAPHYDSFLADVPEQVAQVKQGGQRIRTCLVYLNDEFTGGETHFNKTGTKIRCEVGEALIFENVDAAGEPDLMSLHEGIPPATGEKWVISKWVRNRSQIVSNLDVPGHE